MTSHTQGSSVILSETMEVKRQWDEIFKVLREKKIVSQEFYILQNYASKMKEEIKSTMDTQKGKK